MILFSIHATTARRTPPVAAHALPPMPYSALHHQLEIGGDLSAAPIRNLSVTWQLHVNRARRNAMPTRSVIAMLAKQVKSAISEGG